MSEKRQQEVDAREAKIATDDFSAILAALFSTVSCILASSRDDQPRYGAVRAPIIPKPNPLVKLSL